MSASIQQLLDLEQLDNNLFRSRHHRENFRKTLFGGQVLSQALIAAYRTIDEDRLPHSLHAYFLRAGSSESPVIYDVEAVRDGRNLTSRRAVARQFGRPIFNLSASFQANGGGQHHADAFPANISSPETLLAERTAVTFDDHIPAHTCDPAEATSPFELLPVIDDMFSSRTPREATAHFWIRSTESLPDTPIFHLCALAFASDLGLLATALLPHESTLFDENLFAASIDHAIWFHETDFRADDWLLCETHSPWAGHGRGFARGSVYTRDGRLVASTNQEGMLMQT